MAVKDLDALQWTPGAGKPDASEECWYPIHDKVRAAGKSLWIAFGKPDFNSLLAACDRLVRRYGPDGLYLLPGCPGMTEEQGLCLLEHAERNWGGGTASVWINKPRASAERTGLQADGLAAGLLGKLDEQGVELLEQ